MKNIRKAGAGQAKGKRSKAGPDLSFGDALAVKRSVEEGQLSDERLLALLNADQKACELYDKACKGKRDNPNCMCGLIPAPSSYRRKGLWQKTPEAFACLGPNPLDDKRQVQSGLQLCLQGLSV
jgi:ubiquitin carboxyl-terminal hydrolase 48